MQKVQCTEQRMGYVAHCCSELHGIYDYPIFRIWISTKLDFQTMKYRAFRYEISHKKVMDSNSLQFVTQRSGGRDSSP